jgi:outer membrane lipoprotein-sorting protein
MKSKNLEESKRNLLRAVILPLMVVLLMLGATVKTNAQKYELTGTKSALTQETEITLSGSTIHKFYYLFRIDENEDYHFVIFQVGQGTPLNFAPQKTEGKYVIYEFENFKENPFNFEKFKPTDGILQTGEVTIIK